MQWRRGFGLIATYAKNQLPEVEGYVADVQWLNSIRGQFH